MGKFFDISKNPHDAQPLYKKSKITINPGVTVLAGCNGAGKTTLLHQINQILKKEKIPVMFYDNLYDGGSTARSAAILHGNMELAACLMTSSEGEQIVENLGTTAAAIGSFIRTHRSDKELWILLDAIDSGMSVDNVCEVKTYLFDTILSDNANRDVYIVVSANEYEMCREQNCFDVQNCKYLTFPDYEAYREFILNSRKQKENRTTTNKRRKNK